jgi:hypothetical protein
MTGLIGHIKTHFPAMYRLYLYLKDRAEPPTEDEIAVASGKKTLDPTQAAEYLLRLERSASNIVDAFSHQNQRAAVSFCLYFVHVVLTYYLFRKLSGIRRRSSVFLWNGWLLAISHLKK